MPDMNENAETQQEYFGTKTPKPFPLEEKIVFPMVHSIEFDPEKLPDCIKQQAQLYCEQQPYSYADNREELYESLTNAWLKGFAFCLGGQVTVNRERNEKLVKAIRGVIYIVKNCPKNELALATAITEVEELVNAK